MFKQKSYFLAVTKALIGLSLILSALTLSQTALPLPLYSPNVSCQHIWTVKCKECVSPLLMDCGIIKGHIEKTAQIKSLDILFYAVSPDEKAVTHLRKIKNFKLPSSYAEEGFMELQKKLVLDHWPDSLIVVDWEIRYKLNLNETILYTDTNAEFPVDLSILKTPATSNPSSPSDPSTADLQVENERSSREITKKKNRTTAEENPVEFVKKHYTGNEESVCWAGYNKKVVWFTSDNQKICIMQAKCLMIKEQEELQDVHLACKFDDETESCPSATRCLRDPDVRIIRVHPNKGDMPIKKTGWIPQVPYQTPYSSANVPIKKNPQ